MAGLKLNDIFVSKAHAIVLQFLLDNSGRGFSLRYIARATGVAPSTVGIVVNNLEKAGIIHQQKLNAVKLIVLNTESPITQALTALTQKIKETS